MSVTVRPDRVSCTQQPSSAHPVLRVSDETDEKHRNYHPMHGRFALLVLLLLAAVASEQPQRQRKRATASSYSQSRKPSKLFRRRRLQAGATCVRGRGDCGQGLQCECAATKAGEGRRLFGARREQCACAYYSPSPPPPPPPDIPPPKAPPPALPPPPPYIPTGTAANIATGMSSPRQLVMNAAGTRIYVCGDRRRESRPSSTLGEPHAP